MENQQLLELLLSLTQLPRETEWAEFKVGDYDPDEIGEYLSALANSAALHQKDCAYIVWGVEDITHKIVGTPFRPRECKVGNEELENWLTRFLAPRIDFEIGEFDYEDHHIVLFRIKPCGHTPVRFRETEFIRVGTYKKKLKEYPEKERALWLHLSKVPFEKELVATGLAADEVLDRIDYPSVFELTGQNLPHDKGAILHRLEKEKLTQSERGGRWGITNLGGILFAKRLSDFEQIARKAVRVIVYKGNSRIKTVKEQIGTKGYAAGFQGLVSYVNDQLPTNEQIGVALRSEMRMYPELAIRELVANALIHQDLNMRGDGPMVEIFSDRIEITNPGQPLIDPLRFIDEPPQSRNEALASFMRRMNMCEERGSGIDKVVFEVEFFQLPAPKFLVTENHTKVVLFAHRKLSSMDRQDKIRACYQHACLLFVSNQRMTNATLRKRLSIQEQNYATASRIIGDTIQQKLVKPHDPESSSRKLASYVPFWA
jgi:predicted HTH transcriptional regulator